MFKDFDTSIIDKYLKEKFPIIFDLKFDGLMLLVGGTVKDLMMGKENSKDLDFTLLTQREGNVLEFINKYHLDVYGTIENGYKIKYNDIFISIKVLHDLYYAGHLSTDYLFYDINRKMLIPIGIKKAIRKNQIIDYYYQGYYRPKYRMEKAKEFLTYLNGKKKHRVKYKYNRLFNILKSFLCNPKKLFMRNKNVKRI